MSILIAAVLNLLPQIAVGILSKFVSEKFLQSVLEKVLLYTLEKVTALTTNTLDDELVADIKKRLLEPGNDA
jgi:hypothetical protein